MAAPMPSAILEEYFPSIDTEVSSYIRGLVEDGGEDFETGDDLFDAIGGMLLEVDDRREDDIREICEKMLAVMRSDQKMTSNGPMKILDAPVQLGTLAENMKVENDTQNIWMAKRLDDSSVVDKKKLEKAEQKIKQKQEKRAVQDSSSSSKSKSDFDGSTASASQQSNRKEAKMEAVGANRSSDIRISDFDIAFGEKVLLQSAELLMSAGRRYGLCGRNGIGKTTLLRMISSGQLRIPSHIRILHVEQEVEGDDTSALQSVLECDTKREGLLKEEREISAKLNASSPMGGSSELSSRLNEIYQELEAMEADKAPAKSSVILAGLGFPPESQSRPTREFSGGWRMRLSLARALFSLPDLLLLDEPTNMLDMKAIIWLENYLQTWPTTILVVSHDRLFLNSIVTDIFHMHSQRIDMYKGDFELFVRNREDKLKSQQREFEAQKQYRDHIQVFIDRFRYNANRASQVQSKLKLLEKLPQLKPVEKDSEVVLKFPDVEKLSPPILQLDEVTYHYVPEKPVFKNVCVNANMESRVCIVGENGAGKTTLLKILLGELSPVSGIRHAHRNLKIGYFSQHHVDQLDMNLSSVEVLASKLPGHPSEFYRAQLGSFGISGDLSLRPVGSLSGGQKSRVAFAQMSMMNPNFFILDEPTNHLDMETIEALGNALNKFKGGVILVSHDERLIRVICTELWVVGSGSVMSLEGGIDEYKKIVQAELAAQC